MEQQVSRRGFLKKTAIALGTVIVFDFTSIAGAKQVSGFKAISSQELEKKTMPHVIVKMWPGRSEDDKIRLAKAIVKDVVEIVEVGEGSVSVAIEEVSPEDWKEKVYEPDILKKMKTLYKKPGYSM